MIDMPVDATWPITASVRSVLSTSSTHRLPTVTARLQKLMMTPFIDLGAWL